MGRRRPQLITREAVERVWPDLPAVTFEKALLHALNRLLVLLGLLRRPSLFSSQFLQESLRPSHTGVPAASFALPAIEPELRRNMLDLFAVLRAHAPPSCWSNEVAL